jgi:hypothetical protein
MVLTARPHRPLVALYFLPRFFHVFVRDRRSPERGARTLEPESQ